MKVKILLIAFLSIVYLQANAQKSNDEVTLVVSATAPTEDEAIKTALKSAIEQTYGTFVSANTTLLNDKLVKDEIVTISSGNIKEYNKIESYKNTNGKISVVLKATVCISNLVTYAKSKGASTEFADASFAMNTKKLELNKQADKGASTEFAGTSFAMNMKKLELNKQAEKKALINLLLFIKESLPSAFDRNIQIIDPSIPKRFNFCGSGTCRVNLPTVENEYDDDMILYEKDTIWAQNVAEKCYEMSILISYVNNKNTEPFFSYVENYLESISLTEDECEYLKKTGIDFTGTNFDFFYDPNEDDSDSGPYYSFRNGSDVIGSFTCQLAKIFDKYFFNFYVVDNLGGRSHVDYHTKINTFSIPEEDRFRNYSSGVLSPKSFFASSVYYYDETMFSLRKDPKIKLTFFIPKDKIAQYSSFTIE